MPFVGNAETFGCVPGVKLISKRLHSSIDTTMRNAERQGRHIISCIKPTSLRVENALMPRKWRTTSVLWWDKNVFDVRKITGPVLIGTIVIQKRKRLASHRRCAFCLGNRFWLNWQNAIVFARIVIGNCILNWAMLEQNWNEPFKILQVSENLERSYSDATCSNSGENVAG